MLQVVELPTWSIQVPEWHPREQQGRGVARSLSRLARSVERMGVIEPITVVANSHGTGRGRCLDCEQIVDRGRTGELGQHVVDGATCAGSFGPAADDWWVVVGSRRLRAARQVGLDVVPCLIRVDLPSEGDRLLLAMATGLHSEHLKPAEVEQGWDGLAGSGFAKGRAEAFLAMRRSESARAGAVTDACSPGLTCGYAALDPENRSPCSPQVSFGRVPTPRSPSTGRKPRGRLTAELARLVRERVASGARVDDLAAEFGVGKGTVWAVVKGDTWRSAGGPLTGELYYGDTADADAVVVLDAAVPSPAPASSPSGAAPVEPAEPTVASAESLGAYRPTASTPALVGSSPAPMRGHGPHRVAAICSVCSLELPATGVCDTCG